MIFKKTLAVVTGVERSDARPGYAGLQLRTSSLPLPGDIIVATTIPAGVKSLEPLRGVERLSLADLTNEREPLKFFPDAAEAMQRPHVRGVVIYKVLDMGSSQLGAQKAVAYGWASPTEEHPHGLTCFSAAEVIKKYPKLDTELASTIKWPVAFVEHPDFVRAATYEPVAVGPCSYCGRARKKLRFVYLDAAQNDVLACVDCAQDMSERS